MTRDEILKLEGGRELDVLVAEKVMGIVPYEDLVSPTTGRVTSQWMGRDYSTDIGAAWEVVERIREHPDIRFSGDKNLMLIAYAYNRTYAKFGHEMYDSEDWIEANGEYATPLAICRAALLAVMGGNET